MLHQITVLNPQISLALVNDMLACLFCVVFQNIIIIILCVSGVAHNRMDSSVLTFPLRLASRPLETTTAAYPKGRKNRKREMHEKYFQQVPVGEGPTPVQSSSSGSERKFSHKKTYKLKNMFG
jgi:hypothetical protein